MEELLTSPTQQLSQMGLRGRELVENNHHAQKEAKVLADAIRCCVSAEIEKSN